jgi:hypothetical protein
MMIRDATPASNAGSPSEPEPEALEPIESVDWNTLPPEIVVMICEWLDLEELYFCRLINKSWSLASSHALVQGVGDLVVGDARGAALVDVVDKIRDTAFVRAGLLNPLPYYSVGRLLKEAGVSRGSIALLEAAETFSFTDLADLGKLLKGLDCESRHVRAILDNVDRSEWTTTECCDLLRETGLEMKDFINVVTSMENITTSFRWGVVAELEQWWEGWDSEAGPEAPENTKVVTGLKAMLADEAIAGQEEDRRCQEIGEILREWENGAIVAILPVIPDVSWANKGRLASATFGWGEDYLRGAFDILARFQPGGHLHAFGPTSQAERCDFFSGLADRYGGLQCVGSLTRLPNLHLTLFHFQIHAPRILPRSRMATHTTPPNNRLHRRPQPRIRPLDTLRNNPRLAPIRSHPTCRVPKDSTETGGPLRAGVFG